MIDFRGSLLLVRQMSKASQRYEPEWMGNVLVTSQDCIILLL